MDCVDRELLDTMARAGCREIYFGVETGSPRLQALAKKRLDLGLFAPTLDAADAAGIHPTVSFITGYPQECNNDQAATLDMIGSCFYRTRPPANVQLHLMTPEPGTELLAQFGDRIAFDGFISDFTFPTLEMDDPIEIAGAPDIFMNNHYFEGEMPRRRHVLVSTLYYTLYDLSPPVLCLLLDHFDGRLSRLVDAFDKWASAHAIPVANHTTLSDFCAATVGKTHHLTSLVRYMCALATMHRPSRKRVVAPPSTQRTTDVYVRNADVRFLHDIHDCTQLLDRLQTIHAARPPVIVSRPFSPAASADLVPLAPRRGAAPLRRLEAQIAKHWTAIEISSLPLAFDTADVSRGDFLVVPIQGTDRVRNLPLHPDLSSLLDVFGRPRSLRQLRRVLPQSTRLLADLVDLEILIPVTNTRAPRAAACALSGP
jgi:hypothetical protein